MMLFSGFAEEEYVVAVLNGLVLAAFRYQILLTPPLALKIMVKPGQISCTVPAFSGDAGFGNACACVPEERGLSHPALLQAAK